MMENIVLDTNCLIISLARESIYYPVWRDFFAGKYVIWGDIGSENGRRNSCE